MSCESVSRCNEDELRNSWAGNGRNHHKENKEEAGERLLRALQERRSPFAKSPHANSQTRSRGQLTLNNLDVTRNLFCLHFLLRSLSSFLYDMYIFMINFVIFPVFS